MTRERDRDMILRIGSWVESNNECCSYVLCGSIIKTAASSLRKKKIRSLPPQKQRPSLSHRLGSAAGSDSVLQPVPPIAPAARKLHRHTQNKLTGVTLCCKQRTTLFCSWFITIRFLLQLLGESGLAHVVHEFEQVLPAFAPEAGLNVTQEGQVLLSGVGLREQVLKGLPQRE